MADVEIVDGGPDADLTEHPDSGSYIGDQVCVFCQIACGKSRAVVVDEAEAWLAIEPLGPHAPGHLLFLPRRHVADATIEPALTGTVVAAASAYLGRTLQQDGNVLTSVGAAATQTVMHLHVHVIPRGAEDGLHHDWPWCREPIIPPDEPERGGDRG